MSNSEHMTVSFTDRLVMAIRAKGNPTVMGLDPKLEYIPAFLIAELEAKGFCDTALVEEAIFSFNAGLIDAVADIIPAVKPQLAYYELYGMAGLSALVRTISYAKERGMLVIMDGKRNDIGSTSEAYASAWLANETPSFPGRESTTNLFSSDALTINAYLGADGILPFRDVAANEGKGLFALVRTSNPSASDLQDLKLDDGKLVYEAMAEKVEAWNQGFRGEHGFGPVGAVVGATWPEQAKRLRQVMPSAFFLVPGYGAQGATAEDCVANFNSRGEGAIVNSSRGLMLAYRKSVLPEEAYGEATRAEAISMRDALRGALDAVK